jgi:CRP-like cAMP-binding protein
MDKKMYTLGLLTGSFLPDLITEQLRTFCKQRSNWIALASSATHKMQKYLKLLNLECVTERKLKRKENILTEGENCNHLTFVVKGILKIYHIDKKGNQHNLQFASESKWLTDFSSLYNNVPSELCIESIEPSIIL